LLNKKMKTIMVQERKTEEKRKTEKLETEEPIHMSFDEEVSIPNGKVVLDLKLDKLAIGEKVLSKGIELNIVGPSKVGVIGQNGIGKTTLLKKVLDVLREKEGVSVGYMPQNYDEILNNEEIVIDYLLDGLVDLEENMVTAYMGRSKLNWEEMTGKLSELSYGQRAKIILLKMMLDKNNVLLLDEPTRNLSSLSNPVFRDILNSFKGCVISISHDRRYLREVCGIVYELTENGLKEVEI